jgi:uncharacterized protein (DUF1015 family)
MPEISAFRGQLYDLARAGGGDAAKLITPPYDVIAPDERERLAALDPHNFVHLDLPAGDGDAKYDHAASLYQAWLRDGVLRRDERPALYRYHQIFDAAGQTITRKGFICRMRLHRFDEKIVLPHERTLAGPKLDRLKLTRATKAQLSQPFGMYSDPARKTDEAFAAVEREPPAIEARTSDGVVQRLWRLIDEKAIAEVVRLLAALPIYIADGHHRYETLIAYRDEVRAARGGAVSPRASTEFAAIFLCNMDDPGLVVFPTHRVVHGVPAFRFTDVVDKARRWFSVDEAEVGDPATVRAELARRGERGPSFVLVDGTKLAYLTLRADADLSSVPELAGPAVLRTLDVTLLHALVIEALLGVDRVAQERQTNLRYVKDFAQAMAAAREPDVQAVLLMNPTKVHEVKAVADAGEVMPQKSTFFYPKIASGLVLNPLDPDEMV